MKPAWRVLAVLIVCGASLRADSAPGGPEGEIRRLLEAQVAAWNRGDVEGFMAGYRKSPATTFVGSDGVRRGWQALLDRYQRSYPDRRAMGTLMFSGLEITLLAPKAALILGSWHLELENGRRGGVFTLVVRKFPQGWRIIHDHTTEISSQK